MSDLLTCCHFRLSDDTTLGFKGLSQDASSLARPRKVRRSTRKRLQPDRLGDPVEDKQKAVNAVHDAIRADDVEIPVTYKQAMKSPYAVQ